MRPVFADPRTDFVFKRLFGSEQHKPLLIALLDSLLELDEDHRIEDITLLDGAQRPAVNELKFSIVDVKCRDVRGTTYVVEMQVLNVEGFEKRVVYNVARAYTSQLGPGQPYPELDDVIGVSICDFCLWPPGGGPDGVPDKVIDGVIAAPEVPMLSRWRMRENHSGAQGLPQLQFVFLELPKYRAGDRPVTMLDKWAYFFLQAASLPKIPESLAGPPVQEALEAARTAGFTEAEWEAYVRAGIALQDGRGALSLARREGLQAGRQDGQTEGLHAGIMAICDVLGIEVTAERRAVLEACSVAELEELLAAIRGQRAWPAD